MTSNVTTISSLTVSFEAVSACVRELELRVGVSCSLYSLLFILFLVTVRVFLAQCRAESCFKIIIVVVMVTFGIATATFVLTMYNISTQLQPQSGRQGFEPRFSCNEDLNSRFLLPLFIFQMLVVDSFTIYRTWLLYKKKYSVIIFPCLCSMALFGSFLFNLIDPQNPQEVFLVYYFNLPLSLLLNACCTGFIAVRLIKIHFELKQPRGRLIWQFFVFSGIVYNLVLFFLFIGIFAGWADGMTLVGPIAITCTAAIAFDFLVLQIALTKAFNTHILVAREDSEEDSLDENHETREFNKAIAEFLTLQNELT